MPAVCNLTCIGSLLYSWIHSLPCLMVAGAGGAGGVGYSREGRPGSGDHQPGALNAWSAAALIQIRQCRNSLTICANCLTDTKTYTAFNLQSFILGPALSATATAAVVQTFAVRTHAQYKADGPSDWIEICSQKSSTCSTRITPHRVQHLCEPCCPVRCPCDSSLPALLTRAQPLYSLRKCCYADILFGLRMPPDLAIS